MPFKDPTFGGIDLEDGRYIVKVKALEDAPEGQYGPGIKWVFNVATPNGEPILDERGFHAEFWQFSSDSLSAKSKGGQWATALLARDLTAEDKGSAVGEALIGCKAFALIADNKEGTRKAIVRMTPYAASNGNGKATTPAVPAAPTKPEEPPDEVLLAPRQPATTEAF